MLARISLAIALLACRSDPPPPAVEPPRDAAIVDATPLTRLASLDPRQLAADDYRDRLLDRAFIRAGARVALSHDAPALALVAPADARAEVHPVLARTDERLQIVLERHGLRIALWIDLADALPAIVTPSRMTFLDQLTPADDPHGIVLEPGAYYDELSPIPGGRELVVALDREIIARGFLPITAIGKVWREQPETRVPRFRGPPDRVTDAPPLARRVRTGTELRLAPDASTPAFATVDADDHAGLHARRGGWLDIELRFSNYRVRGWIRESDTRALPAERGHGFGSGRTAPSPWYCLYDAEGGAIIGVGRPSVAASVRTRPSGWAETTIETPFGMLPVWLRAAACN